MLKACSAFLLLFWVLSLIVGAGTLGEFFVLGAAALYAIDLALTHSSPSSRPSPRVGQTVL
jgi:hypothetical protein